MAKRKKRGRQTTVERRVWKRFILKKREDRQSMNVIRRTGFVWRTIIFWWSVTCIWPLNHPFDGVEQVPMMWPIGTAMEAREDLSMRVMASSRWSPVATDFSAGELGRLELEAGLVQPFRWASGPISWRWFDSTADTRRHWRWVHDPWQVNGVFGSMQIVERFLDEFVSPVDHRVVHDYTLECRHWCLAKVQLWQRRTTIATRRSLVPMCQRRLRFLSRRVRTDDEWSGSASNRERADWIHLVHCSAIFACQNPADGETTIVFDFNR